jgi:hypothetical protein
MCDALFDLTKKKKLKLKLRMVFVFLRFVLSSFFLLLITVYTCAHGSMFATGKINDDALCDETPKKKNRHIWLCAQVFEL